MGAGGGGKWGEGGLYHASLLCVPRFQASHVRLGPTPSVSSVKERGCSGGWRGGLKQCLDVNSVVVSAVKTDPEGRGGARRGGGRSGDGEIVAPPDRSIRVSGTAVR